STLSSTAVESSDGRATVSSPRRRDWCANLVRRRAEDSRPCLSFGFRVTSFGLQQPGHSADSKAETRLRGRSRFGAAKARNLKLKRTTCVLLVMYVCSSAFLLAQGGKVEWLRGFKSVDFYDQPGLNQTNRLKTIVTGARAVPRPDGLVLVNK